MKINKMLQVGTRIKEYRKERGFTQKEIAAKLNIPYSTYSNYENNNRQPTTETIEKIASLLGVRIDDLLPGYFDKRLQEMRNSFSFYDYLGKLGYEVHENPHHGSGEPGVKKDWIIHIKESRKDIFINQEEMDILENTTKENIDLRITKFISDGKHDG